LLSQNNSRDIDNVIQKDMDEIEKLADEIGEILLARKQSVAVAEATSGGYITG
jgi:nicotinamide mononucleotide (NMN) deamidase PncC